MRSMVGTPWPVSKVRVGKRDTVVAHRGLSKWKDVTYVALYRDLGGACSWSHLWSSNGFGSSGCLGDEDVAPSRSTREKNSNYKRWTHVIDGSS